MLCQCGDVWAGKTFVLMKLISPPWYYPVRRLETSFEATAFNIVITFITKLFWRYVTIAWWIPFWRWFDATTIRKIATNSPTWNARESAIVNEVPSHLEYLEKFTCFWIMQELRYIFIGDSAHSSCLLLSYSFRCNNAISLNGFTALAGTSSKLKF